MKNHFYNPDLRIKARELRNSPSEAQLALWNDVLQGGDCMGYRFLRNRPVDKFIVDFFSKELNLIIEIKNSLSQDNEDLQRERSKDKRLTELGFNVIWFGDQDVLQRKGKIVSILEAYILDFENLKDLIVPKSRLT